MDGRRQPEEIIGDGVRECGGKVGGDKVSREEYWRRESGYTEGLSSVREESREWVCGG